MPLSAYPNDSWGKGEYLEDAKYFQHSMVKLDQRALTAKQRGCCKNIAKALTESTKILKNSGKQLSNKEKGRLYELAVLRWRNFASLFVED